MVCFASIDCQGFGTQKDFEIISATFGMLLVPDGNFAMPVKVLLNPWFQDSGRLLRQI